MKLRRGNWWNDGNREEAETYWEESPSQCDVFHQNLSETGSESKAVIYGERPAPEGHCTTSIIIHTSYGTAGST